MTRSPSRDTGAVLKLFVSALIIAVFSAGFGYGSTRLLGPKVPEPKSCHPTERYHLPESYRPGAPYRETIGDGSVRYSGTVSVWPSCLPAEGITVEVWFNDSDGFYSTNTRLSVKTDEFGHWSFLSGPMSTRVQPYHIHIKVGGPGVRPLSTTMYPDNQSSGGHYDLVVLEADSTGPEGFLEIEPSSGESKSMVDAKKKAQSGDSSKATGDDTTGGTR